MPLSCVVAKVAPTVAVMAWTVVANAAGGGCTVVG